MKITFSTTKWYRHAVWKGEYRPLMNEPGPNGTIAVVSVLGNPHLTEASLFIIPPERHTVERRKVMKGERYINIYGEVVEAPYALITDCWVIIEDGATT